MLFLHICRLVFVCLIQFCCRPSKSTTRPSSRSRNTSPSACAARCACPHSAAFAFCCATSSSGPVHRCVPASCHTRADVRARRRPHRDHPMVRPRADADGPRRADTRCPRPRTLSSGTARAHPTLRCGGSRRGDHPRGLGADLRPRETAACLASDEAALPRLDAARCELRAANATPITDRKRMWRTAAPPPCARRCSKLRPAWGPAPARRARRLRPCARMAWWVLPRARARRAHAPAASLRVRGSARWQHRARAGSGGLGHRRSQDALGARWAPSGSRARAARLLSIAVCNSATAPCSTAAALAPSRPFRALISHNAAIAPPCCVEGRVR